MTLAEALAAQREHAKQQTRSCWQRPAFDFLNYVQQHDEENFPYLLEALFDEDGIIVHSPSDIAWPREAIAPSILAEAVI